MKTLFFRNPIITDEEVARTYTRDTIISDLAIMNGDNSTIEVRMLKTAKGIISGYFNDMEILCDAIMPYNGKNNIFFTLNPCPSTLAATMNQLQPRAKSTTKDVEITKRRWLIVDIDPQRPSDTSSTSEEQDFALGAAVEIEAYLSANGFPSPVVANSGNGIHCLWAIDTNNDNESRDLIKAFLNALSDNFSNERVEVDRGMYNASRICKLYGTTATKGEDTAERPHRMSKIIDSPEVIEIVTAEQIQAVTALLAPLQEQAAAPVQSHNAGVGSFVKAFDVEAFINANNLDVVSVADEKDRKVWRLGCPFKEHEDKAAFIQQFSNGAISAGCHHSKCTWGWHDLRAKFDPVYAQKQELRREAAETQLPAHLAPYNALLTAAKPNMHIDNAGNIQIMQGSGDKKYWALLSNFVPIPYEIIYTVDGTDDNVKQMSTKIGGWLEGTKELNPIIVDKENLFRGRFFIDLDFRAYINSDIHGGHDKIREIVQLFSINTVKTTIFSHLGFREIDGKLCFLHAKGAIGSQNIAVNLEQNNLSGYEMENTSGMSAEDKQSCISEALRIFDVHRYGNVLFTYAFLAPLCDMFAKQNNLPSFSLWLNGRSGTHKTTISSLLLSFFGKDFSKTNLPLSFNDTENSLTKKLCLAKDVISVVDDVIHPTANYSDIKKQKRLSQDMIFNIANRSGRGRMKGDESLKKTLTPKGMVIFTAEQTFDGISESTTARILSLCLEKGSVNLDVLTECQQRTSSLNKTMGAYIEWLIMNADRLTARLQREFEELRIELSKVFDPDTNKKMIEICAFMHIALDCAMQFFTEAGAVEVEYKNNALRQLDADLRKLIEKQSSSIVSTSITKRFIDVIGNLFADGTIYTKRLVENPVEDSNRKLFVGWEVAAKYYFLVSENTGNIYTAVKSHYNKHGIDFEIQPKELYRRLVDDGIVTETDEGRYTKVKTVGGKQYRVLIIPKSAFNDGEALDEDLSPPETPDGGIFE